MNTIAQGTPSPQTFMSRLILNISRVSLLDFGQVGEYFPYFGGGNTEGGSWSERQSFKKSKKKSGPDST